MAAASAPPERGSVVDSVFRKRLRWLRWVPEHPPCTGFMRRSRFRGAAAAWLDGAPPVVATVLVAALAIAVDDADGGSEGILY